MEVGYAIQDTGKEVGMGDDNVGASLEGVW